ncbi:permease for cytosine/purines, uracil, thiamine, allantoin-domain-containing protein [Circinella umbellata]|nr:permease for cytosine/purines, uracil, thiamine, allantoin-domain-containing protein [Circinella umbellata]
MNLVELTQQDLKENNTKYADNANITEVISEESVSQEAKRKKEWSFLTKVEQQGINPIPEDERPHKRISDNFTLWFSINTNWIPLSLGMLATEIYHIQFWQGVTCILIANIIVTIPGAIFTTFGLRYGLRQIVVARYSYGLLPCYILSAFNVFAFIGWGIIDIILGAQLLASVLIQHADVMTNNFPLWAAVLVISAATLLITIFGYSTLHFFERWTWLPLWIIFFIIFGLSVPHLDLSTTSNNDTNSGDIGDVLSFFSTMASAFPIWVQCAADFTVKQPTSTNRFLTATLNYFGAIIPNILLEIFGLALGTAISGTRNQNMSWRAGYDSHGVGGLAAAILDPLSGFGKFCLILLAFGMIVHVAPNNYGCAIQLQALVPGFHKLPIWVFILVATGVITIASVSGAEHLASILQAVLPLQIYYITPYVVILLIEHFVIRRGYYPIEIWNSRTQLPIGIAATITTLGAYGLGFLGANQSWFKGPAAKYIGEHGGEVGIWITLVVSVIFYPPIRYLEKRTFGR